MSLEIEGSAFVCNLQAPLVNSHEYKEWRETGVAFKLREDAPYQVPNKTLSSAVLLRQVLSST